MMAYTHETDSHTLVVIGLSTELLYSYCIYYI